MLRVASDGLVGAPPLLARPSGLSQLTGHASEDDEPWTGDDEIAAAEGRADVAAGRTVSLDEAMRELE